MPSCNVKLHATAARRRSEIWRRQRGYRALPALLHILEIQKCPSTDTFVAVMPGFDPGIHQSSQDSFERWIAGSSPAMTRFAAMPAPPSSDTPDAPRNCIRPDATRHRSRARLSARPTASLVALVSYRNLVPLSKSVASRCSGRIADTLVYRALSKTCFRRGTRLPGISAPISDFQKFSLLQPQITAYRRRPVPKEGRIAIVTERWSGMRWTQWRRRALDARGRAALMRTAKSCGPDAPTLASSRR